jgi:hypothetical protein
MEWLSQKTSIGGIEISNWALVLAALIILLVFFGQNEISSDPALPEKSSRTIGMTDAAHGCHWDG